MEFKRVWGPACAAAAFPSTPDSTGSIAFKDRVKLIWRSARCCASKDTYENALLRFIRKRLRGVPVMLYCTNEY